MRSGAPFVLCGCLCVAGILGASSAKTAALHNPFEGATLYVNPFNQHEYTKSIVTANSSKVRDNLRKMKHVPSAYWIDVKEKIRGEGTNSLEGILFAASSKSPPELVVVIWYDLPNRDCDAKASKGEICCTKKSDGTCDYGTVSDCDDGIKEYKSEYVDPFIDVLKVYHSKLPVVVVLEPDSLANLATNRAQPKCGNKATQRAYKEGVKYALKRLAEDAPKARVYLDAAHGAWLGWEDNLRYYLHSLKELQLPWEIIRGFALNVANYQPLGIQCPWCPDQGLRNGYCLMNRNPDDPCCDDPDNLLQEFNFGNNEMNFAAGLVAGAKEILDVDAHVIIDTGRNGVTGMRQSYKNWCNPRGAGAGIPSTTKTANKSLVDAYFWLKTPGESDGCSQQLPDGSLCPRYDFSCGSPDSIGNHDKEPKAPEAGRWFDYQVKQLAENAEFTAPSSPAPAPGEDGKDVCPTPAPVVQTVMKETEKCVQQADIKHVDDSDELCGCAYTQCGGDRWHGPTCCAKGCSCEGNTNAYAQCQPAKGKWTCGTEVAAPLDESHSHHRRRREAKKKTHIPSNSSTPAPAPEIRTTLSPDPKAEPHHVMINACPADQLPCGYSCCPSGCTCRTVGDGGWFGISWLFYNPGEKKCERTDFGTTCGHTAGIMMKTDAEQRPLLHEVATISTHHRKTFFFPFICGPLAVLVTAWWVFRTRTLQDARRSSVVRTFLHAGRGKGGIRDAREQYRWWPMPQEPTWSTDRHQHLECTRTVALA